MHGKKIINNSIIGFFYKITLLVLGFVTRKIFIVYIGEELLGLNSLYSNLLELLNMADFGIGVAVQYQLYEPLVNKDNYKLSRIISACRKLYNLIGCFILAGGLVMSFLIQYLIKSTSYPIWYVRVAFLITVSGVAFGYFFVHKRLFLMANEESGLVNIIDLIAKMTTIVISLIATLMFHNYFVYLIINAMNSILSNLFVHFIFNKKYPKVLSYTKGTKTETKELTSNLKNVIPIKLSNYVYNSTDNIVISKALGLTTVALYSNYMSIINGIISIVYIFGNVITSSIGKIIKEKQNPEKIFQYYLIFQYVQYLFSSFFTVSLALLCTPFITWWIGDHFLMETECFMLLVVDFFIHSMYQPAYVMFGATGKFKEDKVITTASAVMNIGISVALVMVIGLPGVVVGTLITDIYIWAVRTYQMVRGYFKQNLWMYTLKMTKFCSCTVVGLIISIGIGKFISTENVFLELVLKAIICCIVPNAINIFVTCRSQEFKMIVQYAKQYVK